MGKVALAAKITHVPSMYLSELPGPRQGTRQDAVDGHIEIGRRCRAMGVDTIVVFDTHWLVNANYHLNCAPHFKGNYTSNELPHFISNMAYEHDGNPELGLLLAKVANDHGIQTLAHPATTLPPEYGTLVPMRYMNTDRHFKVICVSALCAFHYLSESAKLGYMIGCTPESKIQLRIHSNSGSGYFSREWVSLDAVFRALDKCPKDKPLNAFWLGPLFVGKSINTPSFLMAVLLAEGLVKKVDRNYERCDHAGFVGAVNKLIESGVDLKVEEQPKKGEVKPTSVSAKATSPKAASAQAASTKEVVPIKKPARRASRNAPAKA